MEREIKREREKWAERETVLPSTFCIETCAFLLSHSGPWKSQWKWSFNNKGIQVVSGSELSAFGLTGQRASIFFPSPARLSEAPHFLVHEHSPTATISSALTALLAQSVKSLPAVYGFDLWIGKIPWRRKWQTTPVFLTGEFQGQRILAGYTPWVACIYVHVYIHFVYVYKCVYICIWSRAQWGKCSKMLTIGYSDLRGYGSSGYSSVCLKLFQNIKH